MATKNFSFLALSLVVLALASAWSAQASTYGTGKEVETLAEGILYCQNCSYVGTNSLTAATPLPYGKVIITCKTDGAVVLEKTVTADKHGFWYTPLEGMKGYFDPTRTCSVRLLESPVAGCNVLTNVNGGMVGATVRDNHKTVSVNCAELVFFAAGPLAFRPAFCHVK